MYNIVIFCGGTGSVALQKGFSKLLGNKTVNLNIIINAYDNGLSTGECRKAFSKKILGPSDLRKNHLTQFQILYEKEMKDKNSDKYKLYSFMSSRYSSHNYLDYYNQGVEYIKQQDYLSNKIQEKLMSLMRFFFYEGDIIRPEVKKINFHDFSISNIFYSSSAAINEYSLSKAGSEMASLLGINDNVLLISDVSLFLHAITDSGKIICDEGQIINWNNQDDKIKDVFLTDRNGVRYQPSIDEGNTMYSTKKILHDADLIIFSSGTQWSSLIPTYMHIGFKDAIEHSKAKKILVMNNIEDGDMMGVNADTICNIVNRYFDLNKVHILVNQQAVKSLNHIYSESYQYFSAKLSDKAVKKHDPVKLVSNIMKLFYGENILNKQDYMFDLDGTLWDQNCSENNIEIGIENLNMFVGSIVSGNSYEHVRDVLLKYYKMQRNVKIYCDYGNTFFYSDHSDNIERISEKYDVSPDIIELLEKYDDYKEKCQLRGGVIITIKPLDRRNIRCIEINKLLKENHCKYIAKVAGNTTIDITKADFSKAAMVKLIMERDSLGTDDLLFVGNETIQGNEEEIRSLGIDVLQVNDIFECNVFLKILNYFRMKTS